MADLHGLDEISAPGCEDKRGRRKWGVRDWASGVGSSGTSGCAFCLSFPNASIDAGSLGDQVIEVDW